MKKGPRMKALLALAFALAFSAAAHAAPSEGRATGHEIGHGPVSVDQEMLVPMKTPAPSELPNKGKVLSLIRTDGYAFIEVTQGKDSRWIAGPLVPMEIGDTIGYSDGSVMTDFYSKTLKRSFSSLLFADHVAVIAGGR